VAHEWLHQYFYFHPLGRNYWANYDMTSINETAADIGGDEIGLLVYRRYYVQEANNAASPAAPSQPAFDFNKEMRQIRLTVDRYLAQGQVEEAETYMEQMREYLAQNGYYIRKLNQAYFAFHGSYSDTPGSVSPIGGYLAELRQDSPSLGDFVKRVSGVSSYEELLKMIGQSPSCATLSRQGRGRILQRNIPLLKNSLRGVLLNALNPPFCKGCKRDLPSHVIALKIEC
jgi:hypothetical protein